MLDHADYEKMTRMMKENEEFREIIDKLTEDHRFTLSRITHEIRNTLTLISSSLQLIQDAHPETGNFKYWNETLDDVQYLRVLLEQLSAFNKSDLLNKAHFPFADMLHSLEDTYQAMAAREKKTLTFNCNEELPVICADQIKLRQVITNLLKNALEATDPGASINLGVHSSDSSLYIEISDNGCGISTEYLDTIFEPFATFKKNGTGLGLPIARQIVEAHGGTLTVRSVPGNGSTFLICLPVN